MLNLSNRHQITFRLTGTTISSLFLSLCSACYSFVQIRNLLCWRKRKWRWKPLLWEHLGKFIFIGHKLLLGAQVALLVNTNLRIQSLRVRQVSCSYTIFWFHSLRVNHVFCCSHTCLGFLQRLGATQVACCLHTRVGLLQRLGVSHVACCFHTSLEFFSFRITKRTSAW